jgi:energy-coupling factor transporter ATP-binding protein EcfA2
MDDRAELLRRIAATNVATGATEQLQARSSAGELNLADEATTELVHDVARALILATGTTSEARIALVRDLIFEHVLDLGLADPELVSIAKAGGLDLDWLRPAIHEREHELWPAVVSELTSLEGLAARSDAAALPAQVVVTRARFVRWLSRVLDVTAKVVPVLARPIERLRRRFAERRALREQRSSTLVPPLPEEADRAIVAVEQGLLERAVLPALRTALEAELGVLRSTKLPVREALGLGQLADLRTIIETTGEQRLGRLVTTLTAGCIGVAGPRGSGKTTLLEALAAGVLPTTGSPFRFRVRVAAPTRYDSREFLLHLTNILCREVLQVIPAPPGLADDREQRLQRGRLRVFAAVLLLAGLVAVGFAVAGVDVPAAAIAGGLAVVGALWLASMTWPVAAPATRPTSAGDASTALRALQLLGETRYQLSFSSSTSASVSLDVKPLSTELSTSTETSRTRLPLSLPEVVAQFREFVEIISGPDARTLICIDELDKMASAKDTEHFLNDVKAIFGIPNCVFVLSVSEDALASFERRGLPARDAVDSAVDDVVRLEPLDWPGARRLLAERVSRVPTPFWALCFAQTGGLARDLLRFARALFDTAAGKELELGDAAVKLVDTDVDNRCHGTLAALANADDEVGLDDAATWLHELPPVGDAPVLQAWVGRAPLAMLRAANGAGRSAQLVAQFMTYAYLAATIREVFATGRPYADFEQAEAIASPRSFNRFADIRRLLAVSPAAAWRAIDAYRGSWQLPTWPSHV